MLRSVPHLDHLDSDHLDSDRLDPDNLDRHQLDANYLEDDNILRYSNRNNRYYESFFDHLFEQFDLVCRFVQKSRSAVNQYQDWYRNQLQLLTKRMLVH
ncbi:MAG: hypothetical protein Dasosvirus10_8 [Dasosvirus sp.]|uniref:Uncharacterized protein n=1 Tax=Dasosvirus sp. TaxID=2487764 RepID=A0A3G4ZRS3_9VIRU|nr:MAG: hypothetical protein Dasosvirus10_8 [Dasosvirus sp.]